MESRIASPSVLGCEHHDALIQQNSTTIFGRLDVLSAVMNERTRCVRKKPSKYHHIIQHYYNFSFSSPHVLQSADISFRNPGVNLYLTKNCSISLQNHPHSVTHFFPNTCPSIFHCHSQYTQFHDSSLLYTKEKHIQIPTGKYNKLAESLL